MEHSQKTVNIIAISLLVYIAFIKGSKIDPIKLIMNNDKEFIKQQTTIQPEAKKGAGRNGAVE